MEKELTILDRAKKIVDGDRQNDYGEPEDNFRVIGEKWGTTLGILEESPPSWKPGEPIPPRIVALMMIDLKTCREAYKPVTDNSIDIAGYAYAMSKILSKTNL